MGSRSLLSCLVHFLLQLTDPHCIQLELVFSFLKLPIVRILVGLVGKLLGLLDREWVDVHLLLPLVLVLVLVLVDLEF